MWPLVSLYVPQATKSFYTFEGKKKKNGKGEEENGHTGEAENVQQTECGSHA